MTWMEVIIIFIFAPFNSPFAFVISFDEVDFDGRKKA